MRTATGKVYCQCRRVEVGEKPIPETGSRSATVNEQVGHGATLREVAEARTSWRA